MPTITKRGSDVVVRSGNRRDDITVLVVDDNAETLLRQRRLLESRNLRTIGASSVDQAVERLLHDTDIDLVFTDLQLATEAADKTGLDLARWIRVNRSTLPIAGYSGLYVGVELSIREIAEFDIFYGKGTLSVAEFDQMIEQLVDLAASRKSTDVNSDTQTFEVKRVGRSNPAAILKLAISGLPPVRAIPRLGVIDRLQRYFEGELSPPPTHRDIASISPGQVLVDPGGMRIPVELIEFKKDRHPLLPMVEQAYLRCRIRPAVREQVVGGSDPHLVFYDDIFLSFTLSGVLSFAQNLSEFALFVINQVGFYEDSEPGQSEAVGN